MIAAGGGNKYDKVFTGKIMAFTKAEADKRIGPAAQEGQDAGGRATSVLFAIFCLAVFAVAGGSNRAATGKTPVSGSDLWPPAIRCMLEKLACVALPHRGCQGRRRLSRPRFCLTCHRTIRRAAK